MKPDRKKGQPKNAPRSESRRLQRSRTEDSEPSMQRGHLPVWLFVLLGGLLFIGMVYLDNNAGGFNPLVYQRHSSSNYLVSLQPAVEGAEGQKVYNMVCLGCHQPSGMGTPNQNPPLAGSEWVVESDPSRLIRIVLGGLQGPIEVKGQMYGQAAMLAWRDTLDDQQIADVLTYIRNAWGNKAPPVQPEQVASIRAETAGRNTPWTAPELLQVPLSQ